MQSIKSVYKIGKNDENHARWNRRRWIERTQNTVGTTMDEGERVVNKGWMSMNKAKKREKFLHSLDISAGVVW